MDTRVPQPWPDANPWDYDYPHGTWYPEVFENPFSTTRPDYIDWRNGNPNDDRDLNWPPSEIDNLTGLPRREHHGVEYEPAPFRYRNSDGRPGWVSRWNEPPNSHPHGKKRRMAFVWPSDGKRKYTWGRWKDILSSRGPDIFVTNHGDRPSRNQWKNRWQDWTPEDPGYNTHRDMFWAGRERRKYDFRERRYRRDRPGVWADAVWPRRGPDHYDHPLAHRCRHGEWFNAVPSMFGGVQLPGFGNFEPRKRGCMK